MSEEERYHFVPMLHETDAENHGLAVYLSGQLGLDTDRGLSLPEIAQLCSRPIVEHSDTERYCLSRFWAGELYECVLRWVPSGRALIPTAALEMFGLSERITGELVE